MTSPSIGLAALDALLLVAGLAALHGLGLVRGARDALRHAGLALVTGWAAAGIVLATALVLGATPDPWLVAATAVAIAACGVLLGRRVPSCPMRHVGEIGPASWVAVAAAAVLVVQLAALLRRALNAGAPIEWDAWAFWLPKARSIVEFGGLDTAEG